jgi:hypothetical protein
MISIYQHVMGPDFSKLHPMIQKRFGLTSDAGLASIGRGSMRRVWHGRPFTLPFLRLGASRRIMFPEQAEDVPFTIENYAYRDGFGRETVTWVRTFETKRRRRFDAYMIFSEQRECIVDYLGTHQHLAVDLELSVAENGGMRIRSGAQRFYEGPLAFSFPLIFSGAAEVCEWFDEESRKFRISVSVSNKLFGPLFGYEGEFEAEWRQVEPGTLPEDLRPRREERRE